MIATNKAPRRTLRYNSIDELHDDLNRIESAARSGRLRTTGNWTAGQILSHVAAWIEYAYVGFPVKPPPFFVRWILRWMLPKTLRDGMKPGIRIPGVQGGTTGAEDIDTQTAIVRLRDALQKLSSGEPAKFPSPAFGDMSEADRITLSLRHAELHLSFLAID